MKRRDFIRTSTAAGVTGLVGAGCSSVKKTASHAGPGFDLHPFIREHPEAVFIKLTSIESKHNEQGIHDAAYDLSQELIVKTEAGSYPLSTKITCKPNWTCNAPSNGKSLFENRGINTDKFFVEGFLKSVRDTGPQDIIIRECACPDQWEVHGWPEMARRAPNNLEERAALARETAGAAEEAIQKRVGEDYLVIAGGGGLSLGYDEPSLLATLLQPEAVGDILDCSLEIGLAQIEGIASRGLKVVFGGGDMADKNGPAYSPKTFRDLMLPRLKKLAASCRELGLHYVWRTDGKLWPVTDMIFVEAGFPGYGEVDRDADMALAKIRAKYPDLVVWTNVSADLLNRGTRQAAYDNSIEILEESDGRGYLHGCSNAILPGTPAENVLAMTEARMDWTKGRQKSAT